MTIPGIASAGSTGSDTPQVSVPDVVDEPLENGPAGPPPLDPVQEAVESVLDPVEDASQPVKDAVKPDTDPVDETVDYVTETIDHGTTPVTDGPAGPTTNPPPVSPEDGPDRSRPLSGNEVAPRRPGVPATAVRAPSRLAPEAIAIEAATRPASRATRPDASPDRETPSGSIAEQIARAAVDASRAFRFPLLVAAAVLLFLAIQGRIDSRDPKLAHTNDEELMFA